MKHFIVKMILITVSLLSLLSLLTVAPVYSYFYAYLPAQQAESSSGGELIVPMLIPVGIGDYKMQIFRLDIDGKNRVNLTNTRSDEQDPHWSPDGRKILFVSQRDGTDQIYVMDADGKNPKNLTNQPGEYFNRPAWSPDGSQIMYATSAYDAATRQSFWEIWIMDADGSNQKNLSSDHLHSDYNGVWSPDGQHIAFTGGINGEKATSGIWVMDVDGRNATELTDSEGEDSSPQWSPDGKQIAFMRGYIKGGLWLINADGTDARELTPLSSTRNLAWSPDGSSIAFIDAPENVSELFIINADGSNRHPAAREPGTGIADLDFVWSPDGQQILIEVNLYSPDLGRLMLIDVASQTRTMIVDDAYCGYKPDWLPAPVLEADSD